LRSTPSTAADPRSQLDDVRASLAEDDLRVGRSFADAERGRSIPGSVHRCTDLGRGERARPDVRKRHSERRRLGHQAIGDGQRGEPASDGERVHGDLAPGDELLDQHHAGAGLAEGELECVVELALPPDEHEPLLTLAVRRLDHARVAEAGGGRARLLPGRADHMPGVRNACLGELLALPELRGREDSRRRIDRVRKSEPFGDPGRDRNRPVDSRRDDPVDPLGRREPVDLRLVLDRDDRAAVGEPKSGGGRVAVDGDDEEVPLAGRLEQAELAGSRP
jgi:hypothetical protein